jgi:hypothetical protein
MLTKKLGIANRTTLAIMMARSYRAEQLAAQQQLAA